MPYVSRRFQRARQEHANRVPVKSLSSPIEGRLTTWGGMHHQNRLLDRYAPNCASQSELAALWAVSQMSFPKAARKTAFELKSAHAWHIHLRPTSTKGNGPS
jgi:hypothetical protein